MWPAVVFSFTIATVKESAVWNGSLWQHSSYGGPDISVNMKTSDHRPYSIGRLNHDVDVSVDGLLSHIRSDDQWQCGCGLHVKKARKLKSWNILLKGWQAILWNFAPAKISWYMVSQIQNIQFQWYWVTGFYISQYCQQCMHWSQYMVCKVTRYIMLYQLRIVL